MSREQAVLNKGKFYSVIDGTFRVQVSPMHPEAVQRDWETKDGKKGTKYERHIQYLFGKIISMGIYKGDYGQNLSISLDKNEDGETPTISLSVSSRYGEDMLKKLPNLKLDTEYRFAPFDFTDENDKEHKGIFVTTLDDEGKYTVKVPGFFYDVEAKKIQNGYPEPTDEDKEDWSFYYKKANKFLVKYAEENILPKFAVGTTQPETDTYPESAGEVAF